jgi:predicted glycosyltransferase
VNVWLDIDNPPQARYVPALAARFRQAGHEVLLTARASENTLDMLDDEGVSYHRIGASFGTGAWRKLYGVARRRKLLIDFVRDRDASVDLVVTASRSGALAARRLGIPSFVNVDYEHVSLFVYRLAGSYILHPDVISDSVFVRRGIPRHRLIPFGGLKEDFTFAGVNIGSVTAWSVPGLPAAAPRVLIRPPAEESHYYSSESLQLLLALLRHLAERNVQVVYSPRYERQVQYVRDIAGWQHEPVVLERPVPTVALFKGVDAVVSAGGTMLREAAYLGIPAYSIFRSRLGAVDEYLVSIGRLSLLTSPADVSSLRLQPSSDIDPLRADSSVIDGVVRAILDRAATNGSRGG